MASIAFTVTGNNVKIVDQHFPEGAITAPTGGFTVEMHDVHAARGNDSVPAAIAGGKRCDNQVLYVVKSENLHGKHFVFCFNELTAPSTTGLTAEQVRAALATLLNP